MPLWLRMHQRHRNEVKSFMEGANKLQTQQSRSNVNIEGCRNCRVSMITQFLRKNLAWNGMQPTIGWEKQTICRLHIYTACVCVCCSQYDNIIFIWILYIIPIDGCILNFHPCKNQFIPFWFYDVGHASGTSILCSHVSINFPLITWPRVILWIHACIMLGRFFHIAAKKNCKI